MERKSEVERTMYEKTKKGMKEATEKGRNGKRFLNLLKCFQSYLHKCFQAYLRKCFQSLLPLLRDQVHVD